MKRITSLLLAVIMLAGMILASAPTVYAASEMRVSDAMVDFLKGEEGFSEKPYWDYGQYTIGYGTKCPDDMLEEYQENGITVEEAEVLLRNYLNETENAINQRFIDAYNVTLTQGQFDALVSFTYNCGTSWISETTGTFHNAIKSGATGSELIRAFSLWCSAGGEILTGLVRRRLCEANMYLNGVYSNERPENYCYVYYDAAGGTVSYRIQGYDANEGIAPAAAAELEGDVFLGWYTQPTGGEQVTALTQDLHTATLHAQWQNGGVKDPIPEEGIKVTVTGTEVNLRSGPGTDYEIVGKAYQGDQFVITEVASGSGYKWGRDGDKWIALMYTDYDQVLEEENKGKLPKPDFPEKPEAGTVKYTGKVTVNDGLSVREKPSTDSEVLKYLTNGTKVELTEVWAVDGVLWGNMGEGWVCLDYVVMDDPDQVIIPDVILVTGDMDIVTENAIASFSIVGKF